MLLGVEINHTQVVLSICDFGVYGCWIGVRGLPSAGVLGFRISGVKSKIQLSDALQN